MKSSTKSFLDPKHERLTKYTNLVLSEPVQWLSKIPGLVQCLSRNPRPVQDLSKKRGLIEPASFSSVLYRISNIFLLNPPPSDLHHQPSTLKSKPSNLNPQTSTLNSQPSQMPLRAYQRPLFNFSRGRTDTIIKQPDTNITKTTKSTE